MRLGNSTACLALLDLSPILLKHLNAFYAPLVLIKNHQVRRDVDLVKLVRPVMLLVKDLVVPAKLENTQTTWECLLVKFAGQANLVRLHPQTQGHLLAETVQLEHTHHSKDKESVLSVSQVDMEMKPVCLSATGALKVSFLQRVVNMDAYLVLLEGSQMHKVTWFFSSLFFFFFMFLSWLPLKKKQKLNNQNICVVFRCFKL